MGFKRLKNIGRGGGGLVGSAVVQAFSFRLLTMEAQATVRARFVEDEVTMGQNFLQTRPGYLVSIIPPLLHPHVHFL